MFLVPACKQVCVNCVAALVHVNVCVMYLYIHGAAEKQWVRFRGVIRYRSRSPNLRSTINYFFGNVIPKLKHVFIFINKSRLLD